MVDTLTQQVEAAGGCLLNSTGEINHKEGSDKPWEIVLAVNNFDGPIQLEAADQPSVPVDNGWLRPLLKFLTHQPDNVTLGFCDNRYANGGDLGFVDFIAANVSTFATLERIAYAGWNTDGNTIG